MDWLSDLLAGLDEAGAGQVGLGGNPPRAYIPAGPAGVYDSRIRHPTGQYGSAAG